MHYSQQSCYLIVALNRIIAILNIVSRAKMQISEQFVLGPESPQNSQRYGPVNSHSQSHLAMGNRTTGNNITAQMCPNSLKICRSSPCEAVRPVRGRLGQNEDSNQIEQINNEYMMLKSKVETRIKQLEDKQMMEDPSRTRTTANLKSEGGRSDDQFKNAHLNHHDHEHCLRICADSQRHSSSCSGNHSSSCYLVSRQCPAWQQCQQSERPHCYSSNSNTAPYDAPLHNLVGKSRNYPQVVQHIATCSPGTGSWPIQSTVLPVHSNSNTVLNQNISQAILENIRCQKQINTNLKALSQKLSDFSVKRSESSGFLDENYHRSTTRGGNKEHLPQRIRNNYEGVDQDTCQLHYKKSQEYYDRFPERYADQGEATSSEEEPDQVTPSYDQPKLKRLRKNQKSLGKQRQGEGSKKITNSKKSVMFRPLHPKSVSKQYSDSHSRAKSASNLSSSNKKSQHQALNGIKKLTMPFQRQGRKKSGKNGTPDNEGFEQEYFAGKPKDFGKKEEGEGRRNLCQLHASNEVLELYNSRLRRSRQIYKDSQHRNRKHEKDHMSQSFRQQQRLRKQLLCRIAKNFFTDYGVK